jgi:hypothetical protein
VSNRRTELGSNGSMTSYVELWNLTLSWPDQIIVKSYHISKTGRRLRPPSSSEINCPYGFLGNGKPQTGTKRPTRSAPSPCIGGRWCVSLDVTYPPKQLRGLSPAASSSSCHYQDYGGLYHYYEQTLYQRTISHCGHGQSTRRYRGS